MTAIQRKQVGNKNAAQNPRFFSKNVLGINDRPAMLVNLAKISHEIGTPSKRRVCSVPVKDIVNVLDRKGAIRYRKCPFLRVY